MTNPRFLYENRLNDATPQASTTDLGNVGNLHDFRPYTIWKPLTMPATVTVNSGSAQPVDYWLVWGHDLGTQGATIELRKSNDNFAANDVLVDSFAPTDDLPFVRYITPDSEQYWRFRLTGATAPTLGIAAMGAMLEIPAGLRIGFDPLGREPRGSFNRSVTGQPLGRAIEYELQTETLRIELLTWAWLRANWLPAWNAWLSGNPFVFSWDPAGHPGEIMLANIDGGFTSPHRAGGYVDLDLQISGIAQ